MAKCQWSVEGICECFLDKKSGHPACDGVHALPCAQGSLDLVAIRGEIPQPPRDLNPGPCVKCSDSGDGICAFCGLPIQEETELDIRARIARAPAPVRDPEPKKNPGRGGKRPGAGAPRGNLNALKDGVYSQQLKRIHREEVRILRTAREKRAKRTEGPAAR